MERHHGKWLNITVEQVKHALSCVHTVASVMNQYSQSEDSASVLFCVN